MIIQTKTLCKYNTNDEIINYVVQKTQFSIKIYYISKI